MSGSSKKHKASCAAKEAQGLRKKPNVAQTIPNRLVVHIVKFVQDIESVCIVTEGLCHDWSALLPVHREMIWKARLHPEYIKFRPVDPKMTAKQWFKETAMYMKCEQKNKEIAETEKSLNILRHNTHVELHKNAVFQELQKKKQRFETRTCLTDLLMCSCMTTPKAGDDAKLKAMLTFGKNKLRDLLKHVTSIQEDTDDDEEDWQSKKTLIFIYKYDSDTWTVRINHDECDFECTNAKYQEGGKFLVNLLAKRFANPHAGRMFMDNYNIDPNCPCEYMFTFLSS